MIYVSEALVQFLSDTEVSEPNSSLVDNLFPKASPVSSSVSSIKLKIVIDSAQAHCPSMMQFEITDPHSTAVTSMIFQAGVSQKLISRFFILFNCNGGNACAHLGNHGGKGCTNYSDYSPELKRIYTFIVATIGEEIRSLENLGIWTVGKSIVMSLGDYNKAAMMYLPKSINTAHFCLLVEYKNAVKFIRTIRSRSMMDDVLDEDIIDAANLILEYVMLRRAKTFKKDINNIVTNAIKFNNDVVNRSISQKDKVEEISNNFTKFKIAEHAFTAEQNMRGGLAASTVIGESILIQLSCFSESQLNHIRGSDYIRRMHVMMIHMMKFTKKEGIITIHF